MTPLNTFGAIMTQAIGLEEGLADYYERAGNSDQASACARRRQKMMRIRREAVLEITLEAIDGLDSEDYALDLENVSESGQALAASTAARFYREVAPGINVRQARRALERAAREHAGQ
ncbi:MAG: hypothetical protein OXF63_04810 [Anaerolineaceae bacterium]|nr:hypothetical protein [Anaerolineaceae bacterium]